MRLDRDRRAACRRWLSDNGRQVVLWWLWSFAAILALELAAELLSR